MRHDRIAISAQPHDAGFRRFAGIDRCARIAASHQLFGSPINQRECAGFNWPEFSIPAVEPVSISPVAVNRAGPSTVTSATVFRLLSLFPAALLPFCAGVPAIGVGQPARFACLGSWSNRSEPSSLGRMSAPLSFQSLVVVVTQPASADAVCNEMPPLSGRSAIA